MNAAIIIFFAAALALLLFIANGLFGRRAAVVAALPLAILLTAGAVSGIDVMRERRLDGQTARVVATLEEDPLYLAIRDADGPAHARIMAAISDTRDLPVDRREAEMASRITSIMTTTLQGRTASMNDDMTVHTLRVGLAMLRAENGSKGSCTGFLSGRSAADGYLRRGPEARRYLTALLHSTPDGSPVVATPVEMRNAMIVLMPVILQRSGITPEQFLTPGSTVTGNCSFMIGLMETIGSLPSSRAAPLIRAMSRPDAQFPSN